MVADDAYAAVLRTINSDRQNHIVEAMLDRKAFGNFIVVFRTSGGEPKTIINDRGFVTIEAGPLGSGEYMVISSSLHESEETTLLRSLQACLHRANVKWADKEAGDTPCGSPSTMR